jgi:putative ABC transport system substrate-binding protein
MNNRRRLVVALGASALAAPFAFAQQQGKVWRIGYLGDGSASARAPSTLEPFRKGLRDLGYVEGRNIVIDARWSEGKSERLSEFAAEFVQLKVDIIVTHGVPGSNAAKTATTSIPIVVATAADMVGSGLVASLARPGGNVTGTSDQITEISSKEVELLRVSGYWFVVTAYCSLLIAHGSLGSCILLLTTYRLRIGWPAELRLMR